MKRALAAAVLCLMTYGLGLLAVALWFYIKIALVLFLVGVAWLGALTLGGWAISVL